MKATLCAILVCCSILLMAQTGSVEHILLFDTDDYKLTESHVETLKLLYEATTHVDSFTITIAGHTDSDASDSHNERLSARRAQSVAKYFAGKGISNDQFASAGFGEKQPVSSNDTEDGKQQNRRVEVALQYWAQPLDDLFGRLANPPQTFCVNSKKDTIVRGTEGTLVYIHAGSILLNGQPVDVECITIELKEVFNKADMIRENLTTTSGSRILESTAMVYVNATVNGEQAELMPGEGYEVLVPSDSPVEGLEVFDGVHTEAGLIDWQQAAAGNGFISLEDFVALGSLAGGGSGLDSLNIDECCKAIAEDMLGGDKVLKPCKFFWCKFRKAFSSKYKMQRLAKEEQDSIMQECESMIEEFERYKVDNCTDLKEAMKLERLLMASLGDSADLVAAMQKYGVDDLQELADTIMQEEFNKYGVSNFKQLKDAKFQERLENGTLSFGEFQGYAFSKMDFGWSNLDRFTKWDPALITTLELEMAPLYNAAFRIVFKEYRICVPFKSTGSKYQVGPVPLGEKAWIVGIKTQEDKYFLMMEEVEIADDVIPVNFKEVSFIELNEALYDLDR